MKNIQTKRIYEDPSGDDGYRILVDRIWPRGVRKSAAKLDEWNKDIAPTEKLRKWFDHDPDKFLGFAQRYRKELEDKMGDLEKIRKLGKRQNITLLYGAKDMEHNQAVVLQKVLKE